jgi:hypothetical protein
MVLWRRLRRFLHLGWAHYLKGQRPRFPRCIDFYHAGNVIPGGDWTKEGVRLFCECGREF